MKIQNLLLCLVALLEFFMIASFAVPDEDVYSTLSDPSVTFTYSRLSEVEKQCRSLLSSASELKTDEDTKSRLMGGLSFRNGDWRQKTGGVPLMPFLDSGFPTSATSLPTALNMASFEVKDVSPIQHFQNTASVGGYLVIGISRESSFVHGFNPAPNFIRPGTSALTFAFEGVYAETEQNGGERSLCLLGKSTLTKGTGIYVPSDVSNGFGLETDQISLVLRYPMSFSLRNREIHGEMKSLDEKASPKYFDTVYISSQLGHQSMYQFSSTVQASTTCEPYLFYHDEVMEDGVQKFTWSEFCTILHQVSWEALGVFPDYKLGGRYLEDRKLASVLFGKDNEDVNLSYKHIKLILQHVQCSQATSNDSHGAEVSAVLRVIPAETDPNLARTLTGLSGLVFNAEGRWDPSTGKLCMLACRTGDDSELKRCTLRISLYFPRALSIKQRSLVFGSISNIRDEVSSNYHLLFDLAMQPSYLKYQLYSYNLSYNYSKLSLATSFKKRAQRFTTPSHSLLRYPALKGAESRAQLDSLSDDLLIDGLIAPDGPGTGISIHMEVLSLGPLIRHFHEDGSEKFGVNTAANVTFTSRQLLNVSAHLIFRELKEETREFTMISYRNISQVFLEGIYDPVIGEMHLIGCRKVEIGGTGVGRGLDCLIEVEIQYPSENMEPAKITITSQRGQDDPLYFGPVSLLTNKTPYQDHSLNQTGQDDPLYFGPVSLPRYQNHTLTVTNRRTFEGILGILLLSGVVAMTWIQLHYMKKQTNVIPYVSIVMIALQFLGYSLPLFCGAEILFISSSYDLDWRGLLPKVLDYAGKFLVLVYLVLTSRIFLMVNKYQNEPLRTSRMKHRWVPHNKLVLLSTLAAHTGVLIWLSVYEHPDMLIHPENDSYKTSAIQVQQIWMSILKDLAGVVQDFFLLPQIISNFLLQSNVKSLQKAHYMGLTLIRLVQHLYEYISNPFLDSKFQDSKFVSPERTSEFRKSAVVIIMVLLAVIVHIQQNWRKLSQWLELRKLSDKLDEEH